jgi:hypothetical protein
MSDKFFEDPTKQKACMTGYPDMAETFKYRLQDHYGRDAHLSDHQFEATYEANEPGPRKRNDFDPEMFGVSR